MFISVADSSEADGGLCTKHQAVADGTDHGEVIAAKIEVHKSSMKDLENQANEKVAEATTALAMYAQLNRKLGHTKKCQVVYAKVHKIIDECAIIIREVKSLRRKADLEAKFAKDLKVNSQSIVLNKSSLANLATKTIR